MQQQLARPVAQRKPFDPAYDPVRAPNPGDGKDYAPTYWIATAGPQPEDDGPVTQDIDVDVAIIGSGYTGLSCAIHLAKEHGIKATVLEANGVAWGCSTRNGGQAQISAGRLKRSQWIERWGVDVAKKMHVEIAEAFDLFRDLIRSPEIDCDPRTAAISTSPIATRCCRRWKRIAAAERGLRLSDPHDRARGGP